MLYLFVLTNDQNVDNFEYSAFDSTNNFAVITKHFDTLEEAQKYKLEHVAIHQTATIRYVNQPVASPPPGDNTDV